MPRRMYAAAYRAYNSNIILIADQHRLLKDAEADAERMRSPEDETPVFVAYRDEPDWQPLDVTPPDAVCRWCPHAAHNGLCLVLANPETSRARCACTGKPRTRDLTTRTIIG